ncbi:MAG: dienelactone hydrolase family protein [Candidatus Rokubacteria bacterium]|nr:dienelactone hydrolase family protein [Candidatus Rokubacteria bacterium]
MLTHGGRQRVGFRRFGTRSVALGLVLSLTACASQVGVQSTTPPQPAGRLYRPEGPGRFPALVLLPTCAGLRPHVFDWAELLKAEGYVALAVDTLSPRGATDLCLKGKHTVHEVAGDAVEALVHLRSLPFVDQDRIGVIGWSHGAMAALVAIRSGPRGRGFRLAIAFYPDCGYVAYDTTIPVLLLLGEVDDWTPPGQCVKVTKQLQREGRPVVWKVYPGAHHGFDVAGFGNRTVVYRGYTMRYDPAATADAKERVRAFLAQHLRRSQQ